MTRFPESRRLTLAATAVVALIALAACSPSNEITENVAGATSAPAAIADNAAPPQAAEDLSAQSVPSPSASPAEGETIGGDGSEIWLSPLGEKDIAGAELAGELACSFGQGREATLLLAKGNVGSKERAWGVIKVGDHVERVSAPGGYDGMIRGATFAGKGAVIRIAVIGPVAGGGESPPRPATLTYQRADGASRVFRGSWTCGP